MRRGEGNGGDAWGEGGEEEQKWSCGDAWGESGEEEHKWSGGDAVMATGTGTGPRVALWSGRFGVVTTGTVRYGVKQGRGVFAKLSALRLNWSGGSTCLFVG
jgi:hypothetical protein